MSVALLEVSGLVEYGTVGAHVTGLVVLLLADGGDTAGRETCCASSDEFGEAADEFEFWASGGDAELVLEEVCCSGQTLEGIPRKL